MSNEEEEWWKKESENWDISKEEWVWKYYDLGLSIFPIKAKKKTPPKGIKWKYYQKEKPSEYKIKIWLFKGLFSNIAVVCGNVSDNLVVFDIDDQVTFTSLGLKVNNLIKEGAWVTKTTKGYHIFFRDIDQIAITRKQSKNNKMELRGNNHYVLLYPSIHPSGNIYDLQNTHDPKQLQLPAKIDTLKLWNDWNIILEQKK
jgi:hypothetical protein